MFRIRPNVRHECFRGLLHQGPVVFLQIPDFFEELFDFLVRRFVFQIHQIYSLVFLDESHVRLLAVEQEYQGGALFALSRGATDAVDEGVRVRGRVPL